MEQRRYSSSNRLSNSANSELFLQLKDNQDCLLTAVVEVFANRLRDTTKYEPFDRSNYNKDGWTKLRKQCAVCIIKDEEKFAFYMRLYDVNDHVTEIWQCCMNHGFPYEIEKSGAVILSGDIYRLALHIPDRKEASDFRRLLVEICREWRHRRAGLKEADTLAKTIRNNSKHEDKHKDHTFFKKKPVDITEADNEHDQARERQEKYNNHFSGARNHHHRDQVKNEPADRSSQGVGHKLKAVSEFLHLTKKDKDRRQSEK